MKDVIDDLERELKRVEEQLISKINRLQQETKEALSYIKSGRKLNQCGVFQNTQAIEILAGQHAKLIEVIESLTKIKGAN